MNGSRIKKVIYLAGGFRSGWQALVMAKLKDFDFLDPSAHNIQDPKAYTEWDLDAIRRCDVVLGNMEAENPGGYSLALEIGFAKALGKNILLVDQNEPFLRSKYFEMVRQSSDVVFHDLDSAINHLLTH